MSNVVNFNGITRLNLDADRTLEALAGKLEGFVIAGYDKDGKEFFTSTYADGGDALWLLERCKFKLFTWDDGD